MAARREHPIPPQTQTFSSATFRPPPLDGSLSFPELWDWLAEHCPRHPYFIYAREDGAVHTVYWDEAVRAVHTGARILKERMRTSPAGQGNNVVAILSSSDAIPYAITNMGIMRANYVPFLVSIRNSPAAVAHLLDKVGAIHMLVSGEQAIVDLARDALEILRSQYPFTLVPQTSPMLTYADLFLPVLSGSEVANDLPYEFRGSDALACIMHSSGSTAFPKPILWTHHRLLQLGCAVFYGERNVAGSVMSVHQPPMFHAMSQVFLLLAVTCGVTFAVFPPQSPPPVPTPDVVIRAAQMTNVDRITAVPSTIEAWARNPQYVKWLATLTAVGFGGGPLSKDVGDLLFSQGVQILNGYGTTEAGAISLIYPMHASKHWEYFKISPQLKVEMVPVQDGTYELVVVDCETNTPSVINTKVNGIDAWSTSDLVVPHPTIPGYWKVLGRTDDQIMHSSGEKTNSGPLENILIGDPHVAACVMFGRGRFQAGVIVEPKREYAIDPSDEVRLAEFRNRIWPTVEKMNAYAPQHSRLFKEMILVAKPSKPFGYTAKNTVRRGATIKDYEDEINALYDAVEDSTQSGIPPPENWEPTTAAAFVRAVVEKVLTAPLQDDDDIFHKGCDSLQATWIRNTLLRALRDSTKIDTRNISGGFVYEFPSISRLSSFVRGLALGTSDGSKAQSAARVEAMQSLLAKYSVDFPVHQGSRQHEDGRQGGDVVLLTGSTGGFGCHILHELITRKNVAKVYAVNRSSSDGTPLRDRQKNSLADRGLDPAILDSGKVILVEGDLDLAGFGLPNAVYEELHQSVTQIIHNAWRVDFNLSLTSFESNVSGVRALVDLALTSPLPRPPKLLFTSSIGVFQSAGQDVMFLEKPSDPAWAAGTGYGESKWVSEQILYKAGAETALKPVVVRVGQLCGGPSGSWNASEWFPSLVQSAQRLGCLPDDHRDVTWIPLDIAASALVDFAAAPDHITTVHLVHPRPVSWRSLVGPIAQALSVPIVPITQWLTELEAAAQKPESASEAPHAAGLRSLRALQLLPTFRAMAQQANVGKLALGLSDLDVSQAVAASPTLANSGLHQLGADDARKWLAYWRKVGLLA